MERLNKIFNLCNELGITTLGQLNAIKGDKLEELQKIRNKRFDYVCDRKMEKALNEMKVFNCEICGGLTSSEHEGSEPNTCEVCMPKIKEYRNCEIRNILDIIK